MQLGLPLLILAALPPVFCSEIPVTETPEITSSLGDSPVAIASNGTNYALLTEAILNFDRPGSYNFQATIVNADGTLLTPSGFSVTDLVGDSASIASNGNGYLVVVNTSGGAVGIRIDSRGQVLDTVPFPISAAGVAATVVWDGAKYVVLGRQSQSTLVYAYVDNDAQVIGGSTIADGNGFTKVAAHNGVTLVVETDSTGIHSQTLSGNIVTDPVLLTSTGNVRTVAAGKDSFLAVWADRSTTFAQRFDEIGRPLGQPFSLPIINPMDLASTWDGRSYVVVSNDGAVVKAVRVMADGTTATPFDIATDSTRKFGAAAASGGGRTAVFYGAPVPELKLIDFANNVSPLPRDSGTYAFPAVEPQQNVRGAFNGIDYVVIWEQPSLIGLETDIRFARITTSGERLDRNGKTLVRGTASSAVKLLDAEAGGGVALVVWSANFADGTNALRAARIGASGTLLDPTAITLHTGAITRARVLWDGSQFVVFWSNKTTTGVRIRVDGTIVDNAPRQVFPAPLEFEVARSKDRYQFAYLYGDAVKVVVVSTDLQLATASHTLNAPTEKVKSFSIASNGDDFLIVWNNEADEIIGQRASWNADPIGPRVIFSDDSSRKGRPITTFDGTEFQITWPEVLNSAFAFKTRHVDSEVATDMGPILTVADGTLLKNDPLLFWDWAYVRAPISSLVYGRSDRIDALPPSERLFLDLVGVGRRRSASH